MSARYVAWSILCTARVALGHSGVRSVVRLDVEDHEALLALKQFLSKGGGGFDGRPAVATAPGAIAFTKGMP